MISMRALAALFLVPFLAAAALAQEAASPSEFGRAGGGEIAMLVKQPGAYSGSFGFTMSSSDFASKQFTGALGGTLVADRLWFFATGQRDNGRQLAAAADGKLLAQLGDRQTLAAAAGTGRGWAGMTAVTIPSSFLSLRYTGIVSSNSFFTASVLTRQTAAEPAFAAFH